MRGAQQWKVVGSIFVFRNWRNDFVKMIFAGIFLGILNSGEIKAATNVVNSLADSGPGSLRQALIDSNPGDTIQITAQGTLFLTSGKLTVDKNLIIKGPGAEKFSIDGQKNDLQKNTMILLVESNVVASLSDITLTNAYNDDNSPGGLGGAIRNLANLTLTRCVITESITEFGSGGGIYNVGFLVLRECIISENVALSGGGIANIARSTTNMPTLIVDSCTINRNAAGLGEGGGILNSGLVRMTNATISGNQAGFGDGGGIFNSGTAILGNVQLQSCTVVSNRSVGEGKGGGVCNRDSGTVSSRNTIIADNSSEQTGADFFGTLTSLGFNLIENSSGWNAMGNSTGNIFGVSPQLGPLQNNGGFAPTHALQKGSPAIDRGNSGIPVDQRGYGRPYDVPHIPDAADGSDIGAYEFRPTIFLPFEAESGALTPSMTKASDPLASQGEYIVSPNSSGSASFNLNVPESANYVIWCRVLANSFSSDSFFVSVDDGPELIYDAAENIPSGLWQWTRIIGRNAGDPVNLTPRLFPLTKGNHTLVFRAREANTKLDRFLVTDDTTFVPVISFEAESANLSSPAAVFSDPFASRTQYVASPVANDGTISFNFGIPATNQYYVWCRVLAPSFSADSFYVSMDGGPEFIYDVAEGKQSPFWQWSRMIARTNGQIDLTPKTFSLGQAQHTLVFRTREANTKLDKILITSDPTLNPAPVLERYPDGTLEMTFFDEASRTNRVQATATFTPTSWSDIATRVADWNGFFNFEDPTTQTSRFYRTVAP